MNEINNNPTPQQKEGVTKTLAIVGFVALIVFGVWLSVQIVRVIPGAFSSLASIADGVYGNRPIETLTIASNKSIVNANESFSLTWNDVAREGVYTFTYACTDGVSIDARTTGTAANTVRCNEAYNIPEGAYSVDLLVSSEKRRFVDVPFTITFTQAGTNETLFEKNNKVTVVNATIPQSVDILAVNDEDEDTSADEALEEPEVVEEEIVEPETPAVSNPATPTVTPVAPTPTVREETISIVPTSNPNGFVDLKISYLGVGTLDGSDFVPAGTIDNDDRGSLRFEVKNIGSKTSDEWTFTAKLPSGAIFESNDQAPLKPNERATITLGFDVTDQTGTREISGEIDTDEDTNNANDDFEWSVEIVE